MSSKFLIWGRPREEHVWTGNIKDLILVLDIYLKYLSDLQVEMLSK